jgi:tRNA threonylcarbamoyl adenosine modification protein YjeE
MRHFGSLVKRLENENLVPPVLVCLTGDLGVGKTTFVKELFESWGYLPSKVQSPTFLKLLEHDIPGRGLCLHLDCYRIEDTDDFDKLGLESYLDATWWFVEWPEKFLEYLAERPQLAQILGFKSRINLEFSMQENGDRSIQLLKQP